MRYDVVSLFSYAVSHSLILQEACGILPYIKPKIIPPNVVSIFLFLLTNGAANQTGKSETEVEEK